MRSIAGRSERSRDRLAERMSAASYATVLVLAALPLIDAEEVASGWGWELVTGVGFATWVAHLYAEALGDHVRHGAELDRSEITRVVVDGLPILLATVLPAFMLFLGRANVLDQRLALWLAVAAAIGQLVGLGAFVGGVLSSSERTVWRYAGATAAYGVAVVLIKLILGH